MDLYFWFAWRPVRLADTGAWAWWTTVIKASDGRYFSLAYLYDKMPKTLI